MKHQEHQAWAEKLAHKKALILERETRKHTPFTTFNQLKIALENGYIATLIDKNQQYFATLLVNDGYRVLR
jgi:hypothetical protein